MIDFREKMEFRQKIENAKLIVFSSDEVGLILAGVKTQTRRVLDFPFCFGPGPNGEPDWPHERPTQKGASPFDTKPLLCPLGAPGDFLWLQEASRRTYAPPFALLQVWDRWVTPDFIRQNRLRALLVIESMRCERLQSISEEEAKAEGMVPFSLTVTRPSENYSKEYVNADPDAHRDQFAVHWDEASIPYFSWEKNPYVWALTFRQVTPDELISR